MKKIILLLLCILLSVSLFSCEIISKIVGNDNDTNSTPPVTDDNKDDNTAAEPITDEEKLNRMVSEIKTSFDIDESFEFSLDEILEELEGLSFSAEDFQFDGEDEESSVIFKDNTLYVSDGSNEYIYRMCEYGILTVENIDGQVSSSAVTYEDLSKSLTTLDVNSVFNAVTFKKGDLSKTDTEHVYKINRSFLIRLGIAISGNEDFTLDKDSAPTIMLDMREYDTKNTVKLSITNKETNEVTDISITLTNNGSDKELSIGVSSSSADINALIVISDGKVNEIRAFGNIVEEDIETSFDFEYLTNEAGNTDLKLEINNIQVSLTLNATLSSDGVISKVDANIQADSDSPFSIAISYDKTALSKIGEVAATVTLEFLNDGELATLHLSLNTDEYSEETAKYSVNLEYHSKTENGDGKGYVYFPAKSTPIVSKQSKLYLNHGTNILKNYPTYLKKAESLNSEMLELLSSGNFGTIYANYYTYDSYTGIYYITSVSSVTGGYTSTTYSSPDAFRYAYVYNQNLGGFKNTTMTKAESYARTLAPLIDNDKPENSGYGTGTFWTYTYIEDYDIYLIMERDNYTGLLFATTEPDTSQTINGASIHKLAFDDNGKVQIHSFEEKVNESCNVMYVCSHCGYWRYAGKQSHSYSLDVSEEDVSGNTIWRFTDCEQCEECILTVYDGDISVTFNLTEMTTYYLLDARYYDGFENFNISSDDYSHALVITGMKLKGEWSEYTEIKIVIPDLSKYSDYTIVGIDDARDQYNHKQISMSLVIPEGVEFINESAFSDVKYLKEVSLPSTLRIVCDEAFSRCSQLETATFGNETAYIGEDVFKNTLIGA